MSVHLSAGLFEAIYTVRTSSLFLTYVLLIPLPSRPKKKIRNPNNKYTTKVCDRRGGSKQHKRILKESLNGFGEAVRLFRDEKLLECIAKVHFFHFIETELGFSENFGTL